MSARSLYLAAYDVSANKRRCRIRKIVRQYASGGQKSVMECWLSTADIHALLTDLQPVLKDSGDRFALLPLDPRRSAQTLGCALPPADPDFFYFG